MSEEMIAVRSEAVEWLKKHYPALCAKSGLCERIGGKLYTRTALAAQPAASAEPSDEEIDAIAASMPDGAGGMLKQWGYRQFARALLSRYGRPAGDAQPVAWVAADTLNSPHPKCVSSLAYMSQIDQDRGREYVPLYAAPVAAQKADDARDAERYRWLRSDKGYSYGNPKTVGRFEVWQHTQLGEGTSMSGCYLDAAIDAAIAQQRQGEGGE